MEPNQSRLESAALRHEVSSRSTEVPASKEKLRWALSVATLPGIVIVPGFGW